ERGDGGVSSPGGALQTGEAREGARGGDGEQRRRGHGRLIWPAWQAEGDRRRNHDDLSIALDQLPSTLMHHPIMPATEQDQVAEVGFAAVGPMHQVMTVTPGG